MNVCTSVCVCAQYISRPKFIFLCLMLTLRVPPSFIHFSCKFFSLSLQKICDLRGWPAGSDKNTETHEVMFKIWEGLRSKADKDNDGQVGCVSLFCYSRITATVVAAVTTRVSLSYESPD
jgi:hypothetical protein